MPSMSPPSSIEVLPPGAHGDVVIVKPSSLGDIVHTLPAVAWLHQGWPGLRLHWVVNTEWAPVLAGSPLLESVIEFPRASFRGTGGLVRARRWFREYEASLRARDVVLALDFQGLLRSAWLAKRSAAAFVLGLDDAREGAGWFYGAQVPARPAGGAVPHSVERYLNLVRALRPPCDEAGALRGDWLPAGDPVPGVPESRFIVVHPFARGGGKSLGWSSVDALARRWPEWPVVVVGRCEEPAPSGLPVNVINLVGRTSLAGLIGVLRRAACVVSVDSGPMHLASALRRPLVGIHTWSDPRSVGPYDPGAWVWKGGRLCRREEVDEALAASRLVPDADALRTIADHVAGLVQGG